MRVRWAAAAVLSVLAGSAAAAGKTAITQPDWAAKPTGEDMAEHFPVAAQMLGIEGAVTIACNVNALGALFDCKVVGEAPKDLGFGQAALAMADTFRMKPMSVGGQPVNGGEVRIPIQFRLPASDPGAPTPEPTSAAALDAGRALVDALGLVDQGLEHYDQAARRIETTGEGSASGAARAGAAGALRQAAQAHRAELREAYARAVAAVFSEEEMAAISAFHAGHGELLQGPELQAAQSRAVLAGARTMRDTAHAEFCGKGDCGSPVAIQRAWRPADPKEGRIDNPEWARVPDAGQISRTGPELAATIGVSGAVRMTCRVAAEGRLKDCAADEETPARLGFGPAAVKLADAYQLGRVQMAAGAEGRKVTVRVGFPPFDLGSEERATPARSARALELARKVVVGLGVIDQARVQTELQVADYESKVPPGVDKAAHASEIAAYRKGNQAGLSAYQESLAVALAGKFTDEQLTALADFFGSPAGKAERDRTPELNVAMQHAGEAVDKNVTTAAHAIYCATHDCDSPRLQPANSASPAASTRTP